MKKYIPSFFTSLNLVCGFIALVSGDLMIGSILLIVAVALDALDGIAARALNAQSEIGKELDSLADLVSFGIAPAFLYYQISPVDTWYGVIPACILLVSSALRLAIFNTKPSSTYFVGMPTPASALLLIGLFMGYHWGIEEVVSLIDNKTIYFGIALFLSGMMLSKLRMFSLKKINQGLAANKIQLFFLLVIAVFAVINIRLALPLSVVAYIFLSILHSRFSNSYTKS